MAHQTWSKARILATAKTYNNIQDWSNENPGVYSAAEEQRCLEDATSHMVNKKAILKELKEAKKPKKKN